MWVEGQGTFNFHRNLSVLLPQSQGQEVENGKVVSAFLSLKEFQH